MSAALLMWEVDIFQALKYLYIDKWVKNSLFVFLLTSEPDLQYMRIGQFIRNALSCNNKFKLEYSNFFKLKFISAPKKTCVEFEQNWLSSNHFKQLDLALKIFSCIQLLSTAFFGYRLYYSIGDGLNAQKKQVDWMHFCN